MNTNTPHQSATEVPTDPVPHVEPTSPAELRVEVQPLRLVVALRGDQLTVRLVALALMGLLLVYLVSRMTAGRMIPRTGAEFILAPVVGVQLARFDRATHMIPS